MTAARYGFTRAACAQRHRLTSMLRLAVDKAVLSLRLAPTAGEYDLVTGTWSVTAGGRVRVRYALTEDREVVVCRVELLTERELRDASRVQLAALEQEVRGGS